MENTQDLQQAYVDWVLEKGERPASVSVFMRSLARPEKEFYDYYPSLEGIDQQLFYTYWEQTKETLESDSVFNSYSVREKFLALFFTWFQTLQASRSLVIFFDKQVEIPFSFPYYAGKIEESFLKYAANLVQQGVESGEIADRFLVPQWYKDAFWRAALFLLDQWINDGSPKFEKTDAAIEKTVNFLFDLIEPNALDSGVDLLRFIFRK